MFDEIITIYGPSISDGPGEEQDGDKAEKDKGINSIQEDLRNYKKQFQKEYGWHLLAKTISDWTGVDYYTLIEKKPAIEVLGTLIVIKAQIEINK